MCTLIVRSVREERATIVTITSFVMVHKDSDEDDYHLDQKSHSVIDLTNQDNKVICQ